MVGCRAVGGLMLSPVFIHQLSAEERIDRRGALAAADTG